MKNISNINCFLSLTNWVITLGKDRKKEKTWHFGTRRTVQIFKRRTIFSVCQQICYRRCFLRSKCFKNMSLGRNFLKEKYILIWEFWIFLLKNIRESAKFWLVELNPTSFPSLKSITNWTLRHHVWYLGVDVMLMISSYIRRR